LKDTIFEQLSVNLTLRSINKTNLQNVVSFVFLCVNNEVNVNGLNNYIN